MLIMVVTMMVLLALLTAFVIVLKVVIFDQVLQPVVADFLKGLP